MNLGQKLSLDDITLVPEITSSINSRKEVNILMGNNYLPLINAPMYTVVNDMGYNKNLPAHFMNNRIELCLPRGFKGYFNNYVVNPWVALSIAECEDLLRYDYNCKILLDVANGHMEQVLNLTKRLKEKFEDRIQLMVGNIAHPETFKALSEAGADYIRVGIGGGAVCLTATSTAVFYPTASLIKECYELKLQHGLRTKIVADGGMSSFSDIVKSLALGADLVMVGKLFAKSLESDNIPYLWKKIPVHNYDLAELLFNWGLPLYKKHFGMSTKNAQRMMGNSTIKTSEGTTRWYKVDYKLGTWVDNFQDYLRSAMSYCNAKTLEEFKESNFVVLTESSIRKINK